MASARLLNQLCSLCQRNLSLSKVYTHLRLLKQVQIASVHFSNSATPDLSDQQQDANLADYEVSTEEFKYVEAVLPKKVISPPPLHDSYPTPSGWVPPKASALSLPYYVRRTKNHVLPIYQELTDGGSRKLIKIRHIEGDIWLLDADLRAYLQQVTGKKVIASQVHEVGRFIRFKGLFADEICQFLLDKGF